MQSQRSGASLGDTIAVLSAVLAVTASVAVAAYILWRDQVPASQAAPFPSEAAQPTPAPGLLGDPGAFMAARRTGSLLVGMAALEGGPIELYVFGEDEQALADAVVRVSVDGRRQEVPRAACGQGCFRIEARPFSGTATELEVVVETSSGRGGTVSFTLPASFPPSAAALLRRAKRTMLRLETLRIEETLSAGAAPVRSSWLIEAPDRLSVTTSDGGATVLVGTKRWDLVDGSWREDTWDGSRQPRYPWENARNARLLGEGTIDGVAISRIAAFTPEPEPWWFTLWIAGDGRVLELEMLAASHFMTDRYLGFDRPLTIEPPQ